MAHTINVLLVDDNQLVLDSISAWLEDDGFKVHTALCGEDALQLLCVLPVDFIMVDLKLPDMDGETFIVKAIMQQTKAAFAIHTGTNSYRPSPELQNLGMRDDDVLYKPIISLSLLTEMIRSKVHGARQYV